MLKEKKKKKKKKMVRENIHKIIQFHRLLKESGKCTIQKSLFKNILIYMINAMVSIYP